MTAAFCLVLHAHQPYVRRHGAWPCGEDWYHQAASDAYLPLAAAFERLAERGLRRFATVSVSPTLAGQMADPYMHRELLLYLGRMQLRAERQVTNYRGAFRREIADLAAAYHRRYGTLAERVETRWRAGVHGAFAELAAGDAVELMTVAAGHPFLPLLRDDGLATGQLRAAAAEHERLFGARPAGTWLPECGYRPRERDRAGAEDLVAAAGLGHFVVDSTAFERAGLSVRRPVCAGDAPVAAFASDPDVTSLAARYAGGPWYRDFHHHDAEAGFKSFRITDPAVPVGGKRPYEPARAEVAAREDGRRFAREVEARAARDGDGVIVTSFDAELFGHWWFEGPVFLEEALAGMAAGGAVRPATLSEALAAFPAETRAALPASSWGRSRDASTWMNPANEPVWRTVWAGEERLRHALGRNGDGAVLGQAARELVLLSASDWPFMITTGRAGDYARERIEAHDRALRSLCAAAVAGEAPPDLAELRERDNLLPALSPDDLR